jgi:RNA polymerase sigma-70 factor, ECF subfamily
VRCKGGAMSSVPILEKARIEGWTDEEIVRRVLKGDLALFELLMRRHNQRVYRAIRGILCDDSESEDVMQEAYVSAYEHLAQFEGRAQFSTWLTRIAVNEAFKRLTARRKFDQIGEEHYEGENENMPVFQSNSPTPEANTSRSELKGLLEEAILALPQMYRAVIVLRDALRAKMSETSRPLLITVGRRKIFHLDELEQHEKEGLEHCGVGSFAA